ncbi:MULTISPECIES: aspartate ammonia-lyase [Arthrobacter]|uniref:Aspartate ammonia-lyase n=1 Tax=Arthrobacter bambusae TaxID=1338426 RepID=A0AAW8DMF7_9MICC|nr:MULTISPECIES: aspartate ammonia-lyase [Arthrobacter]MDP9907529.1 aspartate ammonia-lyase [Arthrobacter bambusae]MDQ0131734.1 aspartate ammonia-lyase [Arthrobacter bambusae]MDQ0183146.1 aspartate ammonia-lyase [Arthrobacter bambusae]GAP58848.1 aspartate ammonia-lyase [Arthrobacter sp. Hiyo1]
MTSRIETDSLGNIPVPANAYWGAHTARALENFTISGIPISRHPHLVRSLAMIKNAAAQANCELGVLSPRQAAAIRESCREIQEGHHLEQFCVDVIQGGAGTSTNMNANEVIANLGLEKLGQRLGDYQHLHPIDHVNRCQSTNDAYPTAIKLALIFAIAELNQELGKLAETARNKGAEFADVVKMGRTQLQDAVPMTLGQEFNAFAATLEEDRSRLLESTDLMRECSLGATAIGTGITAEPGYQQLVLRALSEVSGVDVLPANDLVEATSDVGVFMHVSGMLKRTAIKLSKISSDLRLLSSGPQNGFGEITLPPRQAGSSIMPGKVNPVIPETMNQIAFAVAGADTAVTMAADNGQLQLNAFEPVIAHVLLQAVSWLKQGARVLRTHCMEGIEANTDRLARQTAASVGLATALVPAIGYAAAAAVAKEALRDGSPVLDVVTGKNLLDRATAQSMLESAALPVRGTRISAV